MTDDGGPERREGLKVGRYRIPEHELSESFTTPGGPGGQHANRNATAVELRYTIADSDAFEPDVRARLRARLNDPVVVTAADSRSQFRNRAIARQRLAGVLDDALRPTRPRRPTHPSKGAVRRRLDEKARRSEIKRQRRRPRPGE